MILLFCTSVWDAMMCPILTVANKKNRRTPFWTACHDGWSVEKYHVYPLTPTKISPSPPNSVHCVENWEDLQMETVGSDEVEQVFCDCQDSVAFVLNIELLWPPAARGITEDEDVIQTIGLDQHEVSVAPRFQFFAQIYWIYLECKRRGGPTESKY